MTRPEFLAEWSGASPDEYLSSLLELAAPLQTLMTTLSPVHLDEVTRLIFRTAATYRNGTASCFRLQSG
ncbi:hypothetical protein W02_18530 [Nitrospira sp. KM1]|nr:hypothetical protein W02_18530 [Nitrospira sp. KM1]